MTIYVAEASMEKIIIKGFGEQLPSHLYNLGFRDIATNTASYQTKNEEEKAKLFNILRDYNIRFSGGTAWSPSEVFEDLKYKGLIEGGFIQITWTSPDTPIESHFS